MDESDPFVSFFPALPLLISSFFIGSLPFREILIRFVPASKLDVFWPIGLLTCILDALKGALSVILALPVGFRLFFMVSGANLK